MPAALALALTLAHPSNLLSVLKRRCHDGIKCGASGEATVAQFVILILEYISCTFRVSCVTINQMLASRFPGADALVYNPVKTAL